MKFTIVIVRPPGYRFSDCFNVMAETVMYGLRSLGHEAEITDNKFRRDARHIIFGAQLLSEDSVLPEDSILYNFEQVGVGYTGKLDVLGKKYTVWDYAAPNCERWKERGIDAVHVPLGYVPEMTRIQPAEQDIDVLFYGSLSPRRQSVVAQLAHRCLKVVERANNAYGHVLDELIARAKVVLAMHYAEAANIFGISRVGYLLANKKAIVSEASIDDHAFRGCIPIVPYSELVDACHKLACDETARRSWAASGHAAFCAMPEPQFLADALKEQVPAFVDFVS